MVRLALIALLIFSATALAGPVPRGQYGDKRGRVEVSTDGRTVKYARITLAMTCRDGTGRRYPRTVLLPRPKPIRGGAFSYRVVRPLNQGAGSQTEFIRGRFSADGKRVTLVARYLLARRDGRGCDTGTRRHTLPITGVTGSAPFEGRWTGQTRTGEPISMTVSGNRVTNITARVRLECDDGTTMVKELSGLEATIVGRRFRAVSGLDEVTGYFEEDDAVEGEVSGDHNGTETDPRSCNGGSLYLARPL